jgi:serine/threonine protein kinase/TolB-like protein/Flp pilus assembly protein TadD
MARMSQLLEEALALDEAGRRIWLERASEEHPDLAAALREALLPGAAQAAQLQELMSLPKLAAAADEARTPDASGLVPGARVGPYQLIRRLGAGGMAEVWLARRADGAFKREVALKLPMLNRLQAGLELRFARERDILASLEHPHIARLYDAGVDPQRLPYLSMEYVQGAPLTDWCDSQRLGIPQRLALFLQVLEAVQYAHEKNVIHRDLKPSNILVTDSGQVRLLDFGVARLLEAEETDLPALTSVFGRALTPDYASPELLRGDPIDTRSDLYSLGVLLYELLTGIRPYRLKSAASIGALDQAIATIEIKKPSMHIEQSAAAARASTAERLARQLRGDLDAVVLKALAKEPAQRYPSAGALAEDLRRYLDGKPIRARPARIVYRLRKFVLRNRAVLAVSVAALAAILAVVAYTRYRESVAQVTVSAAATNFVGDKSIAVLPFVDMSEHKDQEYFSDGLSEELIDMLTKIPELRVPARTSSFYFKGKQATIADIAKALGVAHVLEGSVRKSGNTLRVTAQLIRADNGYHVWSQTYDRKLDDIFQIQDEIAKSVVNELKVSVLGGTIPRATPTTNHDAYLLYLQAKELQYRGNSLDSSRRAIDYLHEALKLDPEFSQGWLTLASFLAADYNLFDVEPHDEARALIYSALDHVRKLEPSLPPMHVVLGRVLYEVDWSWQAADAELKQAIELEPGNSEAHRLAAYLATTYGRFDEAIEQSEKAIELDPLQPWNYIARGYAAYRSGRLAQAESDFRTALDLAPGSGKFHCLLGAVLIARGQPESALAETKKESNPRFRHVGMALALGALGQADESDRELRTAEQMFGDEMGYWIAMVYAARGDPDRAFAWLDRAFNVYGEGITWIKGDPLLGSLVEDPRYKGLLQKMRLPE